MPQNLEMARITNDTLVRTMPSLDVKDGGRQYTLGGQLELDGRFGGFRATSDNKNLANSLDPRASW